MSYSGQLVADRYRLTRQIGAGGMGRVWLARDEVLHRDVAVKEVVLPPELGELEREELFRRTLREARAAGRLNHPNVVAVYDVVQAEGRPWIVMELVRSRSLYQVVREDGPISPKRTAEVGLAVLAALRAAHAAGVWHRDVKPGNVLLADDGRVVLTDFGLATFDGDGTVTRSGVILGSAQYISPERAREGSSGPESDLWSLGATLYAAVEGRPPFARETSMATLTALATAPPDTPKRAGPLRPVLIGLLRKNPRHRMRADEVRRLLQRVVDGDVKGLGGPKVGRTLARRVLIGADADGRGSAADRAAGSTSGAGWDEGAPRQATRRAALAWALLAAVAGLAIPAVVIFLNVDGPNSTAGQPAAPSSSGLSPASVNPLTAAMRVQACAMQAVAEETTLTVPSAPDAAAFGLLPNWGRYADPSGFDINLPGGWGISRIGELVCFRDPTSAKTAAVYRHGSLAGNPVDLIGNTTAWRAAANMVDFKLLGITDVGYRDGAADLEYTYLRGNIRMHGVNRMLRMDGEVYTIYFLATEVAWPTDREVMSAIQPSFTLAG